MTFDDCFLEVSYSPLTQLPKVTARGTNITVRCRDKFIEMRKYPTGILIARHWCEYRERGNEFSADYDFQCNTHCPLFDAATKEGKPRWS